MSTIRNHQNGMKMQSEHLGPTGVVNFRVKSVLAEVVRLMKMISYLSRVWYAISHNAMSNQCICTKNQISCISQQVNKKRWKHTCYTICVIVTSFIVRSLKWYKCERKNEKWKIQSRFHFDQRALASRSTSITGIIGNVTNLISKSLKSLRCIHRN